MTQNCESQTGLDRHIARLREVQRQKQHGERMAALSARCANMKRGWLLVKVEDGSPRSIRRVKVLADGITIQL